jgi:hypothetical protein
MRIVRASALAIALALPSAGAPGCGFPDVTYASPRADASPDVASPSADAGDGPDEGARLDAPSDEAAPDALAGDDAIDEGQPADAPGAEASDCDRDRDTYSAEGDATCWGYDCDDTDPHANPGVGMFQTYAPHPPTNGDWNCDGKVDKQYPVNVVCSALPIAGCNSGFTGDPPCGATAPFVQCMESMLGFCMQGATIMQQQGCL